MNNGLDDLVGGKADIEGRVHVDLELGLAAAEGGEHAERDELALRGGETRAGVDLAEAIGDNVMRQVRCDIGQSIDNSLPTFPVDRSQDLCAALVPSLVDLCAELVLTTIVLAPGRGRS